VSKENSLLGRFWRWLQGPQPQPDTHDPQLAVLEQQLQATQDYVKALQEETVSLHRQLAETMQTSLSSLEKQVNRAGREQFKANTLAENQSEQLGEALDWLRSVEEHRVEALQRKSEEDQTAARLEVAQSVLPALDGLDEALRSGQTMLSQPVGDDIDSPLLNWLGSPTTRVSPEVRKSRESLDAWLSGLTFVQQRLLNVLAAEDIHPIEALHKPFDPNMHIAMDVVPATPKLPPGMVAAELRRGYVAGSRVLRPAEVVVTREHTGPVGTHPPRTVDQATSKTGGVKDI
jgi:molecular chaperone GrpE